MTATTPRDSIRDWLLVVAATLCLAVEILYLLHQMKIIMLPLPWEKGGARGVPIGKVLDKRMMLRSRGQKSLTWFPMGQGEAIYLHDTLLTGSSSWAKLEISGEGEIDLEADTLLKFSQEPSLRAESILNLELGQGIVRVKSAKKVVNVKLKSRELAVTPDSEVVLSRPALAEQSQVQVRKGEVKLIQAAPIGSPEKGDAESKTISLKAGEALQIHPDRGLAKIDTNLKIEPKYPTARARIVAQSHHEALGLYWSGDEGLEVEVGLDPEFNSAKTFRAAGKSAQVELPPGQYFWRIRRDVAMSPTQEFTLLPPSRYQLSLPLDGSVFKEGASVVVRWAAVEEASHYSIEVSRSQDFKEALLQSDVNGTTTQLSSLKPGVYYWRVRATHKSLGNWPPSTAQSFVVKKRIGAPKPKGAKVLPARDSRLDVKPPQLLERVIDWVIPPAFAGEAPEAGNWWIEFAWEAADGAAKYRLEVYDANDRQTPLKSIDLAATQVDVELPRCSVYQWRVAAIDEYGEIYEFSKVQTIRSEIAKPKSAPTLPVAVQMPVKRLPLREIASLSPWPVSSSSYPRGLPSGIGIAAGGVLAGGRVTEGENTVSVNEGTFRVTFVELSADSRPWGWMLGVGDREAVVTRPGVEESLSLRRLEFRVTGDTCFDYARLMFGVQFREELDFDREGPSQMAPRRVGYYPVLLGGSLGTAIDEKVTLVGDALVEGAPFGTLRGVGILLRGRVLYDIGVKGIWPELQASVSPRLGWLAEKRRFDTDFQLALCVRFRWDG